MKKKKTQNDTLVKLKLPKRSRLDLQICFQVSLSAKLITILF